MATGAAAGRRTYLVHRLVNKQITMEEATELFSLMSRELEALRKQAIAGRPVPPPPEGKPPPPPPGWSGRPAGLTENLEEILLFGGPLLGVLAALMKRSGVDLLSGVRETASAPKGRGTPPAR